MNVPAKGQNYIPEFRFLDDDINIWLIYSGRNRVFLEDFTSNGIVFLNTPGFSAKKNTFNNDEEIARHLTMSTEISRWISKTVDKEPSRTPQKYSTSPNISNPRQVKAFSSELGNVKRLFKEVKSGDILISPGKNPFDPLLIGEVVGEWDESAVYAVPHLKDEYVPVRNVHWLPEKHYKNDYSVAIARRLKNRQAITKIDKRYYDEIFDSIYQAYTRGSRSKLDIFGDSYAGKDPLQPYESARLIKYITASAFAFEKEEMKNFTTLDMDDAIEKYYEEDLILDVKINFNSPGKYTVITKSKIFTLLLCGGILLSINFDDLHTNGQAQALAQNILQQTKIGVNQSSPKVDLADFLSSLEAAHSGTIIRKEGKKSNQTMPLSFDKKNHNKQKNKE